MKGVWGNMPWISQEDFGSGI